MDSKAKKHRLNPKSPEQMGSRRSHSTWLIVSAALHGLAAAGLLWLTPAGARIRATIDSPRPISAARLMQLAESLRDRAATRMREDITALNAIDGEMEALTRELSGALPVPAEEAGDVVVPPPADPGAAAGLVDLHAVAHGLERAITDRFAQVRAMDLAIRLGLPLREARAQVELVPPPRRTLDAVALDATRVGTQPQFARFRAEVEAAVRQTGDMVAAARRIRDAAIWRQADLEREREAPVPVADEDMPHFMADMVSDYHGGHIVDMASWMQEPTDLDDDGHDGYPHDIMGPARFERPPPAQLTAQTPALGARRIVANGTPTAWMYVDAWYTIGPFPNPARENVQREFPPDRAVDLDATYTGKGGAPIRWQFVQSHDPRIHPADPDEYGVWYAYTELYFDRPRDLWMALGSDDYGRLQVNGITVWESVMSLKGWRIDEAWRRVHFREGLNRLLFRLENGFQDLGFSVTLWLGEEP